MNILILVLLFPTLTFAQDTELKCLTDNIYFESGNQTLTGKRAVAAVTMNRVKSSKYPNTICGVVKQAKRDSKNNVIKNKCQFSWFCDGATDNITFFVNKQYRPDIFKIWQDSYQVAAEYWTNKGLDITNGALFYYNPDIVTPYWASNFVETTQIENHRFGILTDK